MDLIRKTGHSTEGEKDGYPDGQEAAGEELPIGPRSDGYFKTVAGEWIPTRHARSARRPSSDGYWKMPSLKRLHLVVQDDQKSSCCVTFAIEGW